MLRIGIISKWPESYTSAPSKSVTFPVSHPHQSGTSKDVGRWFSSFFTGPLGAFPSESSAAWRKLGQAYEPQSVNDVMVHHAKDLVDQNNMQALASSQRVEDGRWWFLEWSLDPFSRLMSTHRTIDHFFGTRNPRVHLQKIAHIFSLSSGHHKW